MKATRAEVSDAWELHRLIPALHRVLDDPAAHNEQALGKIYRTSARLQSARGQVTGLSQIAQYVRDNAHQEERSRHSASDVIVDISGDEARITANVLARYFCSRTLLRTAGLQYAQVATRTPAGWQVAGAEITLDWLQPAPP